jgi:hypothetical protein
MNDKLGYNNDLINSSFEESSLSEKSEINQVSDYVAIKYLQEDPREKNQSQMNDSDLNDFKLETHCNEVFTKAPIKFKARTNKPLEL